MGWIRFRDQKGADAVSGITDVTPVSPLPVSKSVAPSAAYTRPANTTAYAAGDVISDSTTAPTILTFAACARGNGLGGVIHAAVLIDSSNPTTKADLELYLFRATPGATNDNAAIDWTDAELLDLVGVVDFGSTPFVGLAGADGAGNCIYQKENVGLEFTCAAADKALYGVLVVRNAYTPIASEVFTVTLGILQD